MIIKSFVFMLCNIICAICLGASGKTITGKVVNTNGEVLPYCHISVSNNLGTISNSDGEFLLYIADSITVDSLFANYLGYKKTSVSFQEHDSLSHVIITMSKDRHALNEIKIYPVSAISVIDSMKMYRRYNRDTSCNQLSAFMRETNKINNKYYQFAEGIFKVHRNGSKGDLIELEQARLVKDIGDEKIEEHLKGIADSMKFCLDAMPYRLMKIERIIHNFFSKKNLRKHNFAITGSVTIEDEVVIINQTLPLILMKYCQRFL